MKSPFKKDDKDKKIFKDGYAQAEKELIPIWKAKFEDAENEHRENLAEREFEIKRLTLKLNSWEADQKKFRDKESELKAKASKLKTDIFNFEKAKEYLAEIFQEKYSNDVEGTREILSLLGKDQIKQLEND